MTNPAETQTFYPELSKPKFDQRSYIGRVKHFLMLTNPLHAFASNKELDKAKAVMDNYRKGNPDSMSEDELWRMKYLYDSAYHPDTGEKTFLLGRMSSQTMIFTAITGCMLQWYRTLFQTIFWQWLNQTCMAVVNYVNRSGTKTISNEEIALSYGIANSGAVGTAILLNSLATKFSPIARKFVPFAAVATANCINIPFMRKNELVEGIPVFTPSGKHVGDSREAAVSAISKVVVSRVAIVLPAMILPPIVMTHLEKNRWIRRSWMKVPVISLLSGLCFGLSIPMSLAIFPQRSHLAVSKLNKDLQEKVKTIEPEATAVFFNKGL